MAAKKRKAKKKVAKKANPLVALKAKLAELKAQSKAVNTDAKDTAKRADALVKSMGGAKAAPAAKAKAKTTKKKAKKRKKSAAKKK